MPLSISHIVGFLTYSFLHCCFSSLRLADMYMHSLLEIPLHHLNTVQVFSDWATAASWFFAGVFGIIALFKPGFSFRTHGFTFDCRILWYAPECMADSVTIECTDPVAGQQAQIIPLSSLCRHLVWFVCAGLVFSEHGAMSCGQISPLWSYLSKKHCSRSHVFCPALQT